MGDGYILQCKKCGYEQYIHLGVGFSFYRVYQETVNAAKNGKYGETLRTFLEEHPDGILNCSNVLLQCTECGHFETGLDLSMYIPKRDIMTEEGRSYVIPWLLEDYELIGHYDHRCRKCGAGMKTVSEEATGTDDSRYGNKAGETGIACPRCGKPLWKAGRIMWD